MFDNLTERLSNSFKALQGKNKLSEDNIKEAIREVRRSLLEADVALDVIKFFLDKVQEKAIGLKVSEGLTPSQAFIKLVESELTDIIGGQNEALNLATQPPAVVMVAGLQGSGKTTSIAKLARYLKEEQKKKVLVVSADVYRPAAIEQLKILAEQIGVDFFPSTVDAALGSAHITVNKNSVPHDPQSPFITSGIRVGTPAATTRGFGEKECVDITHWICDICDDIENTSVVDEVRAKVESLCSKFPVYQ